MDNRELRRKYDFNGEFHYQQARKIDGNNDKTKLTLDLGLESPPFSRLFVLYTKTSFNSNSYNELKAAFERYGCIEEILVVRDKENDEEKGMPN